MFSASTNPNAAARQLTVVLADDHPIFREGLRLLLESAGSIRVIGEAENGLQAVQRVKKLRPDLVILDLAMPVLNGKEAARQIIESVRQTKVLILSSYSEDHYVRDLIEIGVCGFLLKQSAAAEIFEAIQEIRKGNRFFSAPISKRLAIQTRRTLALHGSANGGPASAALTPRETQVLQLVAEGHRNKGIASVLGISIKTVEKHRQQVMNKLNLHDVAGLTRYAILQGMLPTESAGQPSL
jgi:DNA-binding NarL/FixJ family response regulator